MKPLAIQDVQKSPSVLTEAEPSERHEIPYFDSKYCLSAVHSPHGRRVSRQKG